MILRGPVAAALMLILMGSASAEDMALTEEGTILQLGEYTCTLPDGTTAGGPSFIAMSDTDYTDMAGANAGGIAIAEGQITFSGGLLDGLTGTDITPRACLYAER